VNHEFEAAPPEAGLHSPDDFKTGLVEKRGGKSNKFDGDLREVSRLKYKTSENS